MTIPSNYNHDSKFKTDATIIQHMDEHKDDPYDFLPIDDSEEIQKNLWKLPMEEVESTIQPDCIELTVLHAMLDSDD